MVVVDIDEKWKRDRVDHPDKYFTHFMVENWVHNAYRHWGDGGRIGARSIVQEAMAI